MKPDRLVFGAYEEGDKLRGESNFQSVNELSNVVGLILITYITAIGNDHFTKTVPIIVKDVMQRYFDNQKKENG